MHEDPIHQLRITTTLYEQHLIVGAWERKRPFRASDWKLEDMMRAQYAVSDDLTYNALEARRNIDDFVLLRFEAFLRANSLI